MRQIIVGIGLLALMGAPARGQSSDPSAPTAVRCAGVYGALAQDQTNFGRADSLMGERYFSFAKIDFEDRLARLAGKAEKGITEMKTASESDRASLYMKLVDAETEGDMSSQPVRELVRLSDTCDAEYGFSPSLGG